MHNIQPLHTKVEKLVRIALGDVVLENPDSFPRNESNLYLVSPDGELIWKAEKPDPNTLFSRIGLNEDGNTLSTYTIGGHACEVDLKTGKLISQTRIQ
jgi:hypothetical protein